MIRLVKHTGTKTFDCLVDETAMTGGVDVVLRDILISTVILKNLYAFSFGVIFRVHLYMELNTCKTTKCAGSSALLCTAYVGWSVEYISVSDTNPGKWDGFDDYNIF